MRSLSHQELLRVLSSGESSDSAWEEFVRRFRRRISLAAIRAIQIESHRSDGIDCGPTAELAEDICQDVFARLLVNNASAMHRFEGKHEFSFHSYLNTITVNLVRDHFKMLGRKKRPAKRVLFSDADGEPVDIDQIFETDEPGPERRAISNRLRERIEKYLMGVATESEQRLVFRLYFYEGLSLSEIAKLPNMSLTRRGVEKQIGELRGRLKEHLSAPEA